MSHFSAGADGAGHFCDVFWRGDLNVLRCGLSCGGKSRESKREDQALHHTHLPIWPNSFVIS